MVEDQLEVLQANQRLLQRRNCLVLTAQTVKEALTLLSTHQPNLLILDIMLPDGTGYEICQHFRQTSNNPVLFLSAKTEINDRIESLKCGCDYYLTKPYSFDEFYAVIQRLLDREKDILQNQGTVLTVGNLVLDMSKNAVFLDGKDLLLTKTEFALLLFLMQNIDKELTKERIYEEVWGNHPKDDTRVVSKHISKLRQKTLCDDSDSYDIISSYGKGYKFIRC